MREKMKILLLTNHLAVYAGSEIQILELYRYFKAQNHEVFVYANYINSPMLNHFAKQDVFHQIDDINLDEFDLVWVQHSIFARLFKNKIYLNLNLKIISAHLSPFEPFEYSSLKYMQSLGVTFVANSEETRDKLSEFGISNVYISHNAAPEEFIHPIAPQELKRIVIISNHPHVNVLQAAEILKEKGLFVDYVGMKDMQQKFVTPELLLRYDCIITIGKTVQYALLSKRAIYCYDHFDGCGYLNQDNYQTAKYYNFSGRGFDQKKKAQEIADEIISGFGSNIQFVKTVNIADFILSNFIKKLAPESIHIAPLEQEKLRLSYPSEEIISNLYNLYQKERTKAFSFAQELRVAYQTINEKTEQVNQINQEVNHLQHYISQQKKELTLIHHKVTEQEQHLEKQIKKQKHSRMMLYIAVFFCLILLFK